MYAKRTIIGLVLFCLLLVGAAQVSARSNVITLHSSQYSVVSYQDATPEPPSDSTPIPLDQAGQTIINDVAAIIASYGAVVGAAGAIIVGGLKFLPYFNDPNNISGSTLNLLVNGVLVIGLWIATHFGLSDQYQTGLTTIQTVGQAILALLATVLGSALWHGGAAKMAVPIIGKQRPVLAARASSQLAIDYVYPPGE